MRLHLTVLFSLLCFVVVFSTKSHHTASIINVFQKHLALPAEETCSFHVPSNKSLIEVGHFKNLWLLLFHSEISRKQCQQGALGEVCCLHAGFHRRSRTARRVIVRDRVRANLLVAREGGGGARGKRAWRGEGACARFH